MLNFILGLAIGGVAAIFIYRNNQKKLGMLADKIDELVEQIKNR